VGFLDARRRADGLTSLLSENPMAANPQTRQEQLTNTRGLPMMTLARHLREWSKGRWEAKDPHLRVTRSHRAAPAQTHLLMRSFAPGHSLSLFGGRRQVARIFMRRFRRAHEGSGLDRPDGAFISARTKMYPVNSRNYGYIVGRLRMGRGRAADALLESRSGSVRFGRRPPFSGPRRRGNCILSPPLP